MGDFSIGYYVGSWAAKTVKSSDERTKPKLSSKTTLRDASKRKQQIYRARNS